MGASLQHSMGHGRFAVRHVAAGVICALAFYAIGMCYGATPETVELCVFAGVLLKISLVDIDKRIIPNAYLAFACVVRLAYLGYSCACGLAGAGDVAFYAVSAIGVGSMLALVVMAADALFGSESMGGGDLKLYSVAAWYFGWERALIVIMLSCLISIVAAVASRLKADVCGDVSFMKRTLPFGPAIAAACVAVMLLG